MSRGFTLVELLVVMVILGTLVGFLLPAILSARAKARMTACRNNLSQIAFGLQSYLDDYGGMLPPAYIVEAVDQSDRSWNWARIVADQHLHDRAVMKCPADTSNSEFSYRYNRGEVFRPAFWYSYRNDVAQLDSEQSHPSVTYVRIRDKCNTILVGEDAHPDKIFGSVEYSAVTAHSAMQTVLEDDYASINPHGDDSRMNYLLADMHVQSLPFPHGDAVLFHFFKGK